MSLATGSFRSVMLMVILLTLPAGSQSATAVLSNGRPTAEAPLLQPLLVQEIPAARSSQPPSGESLPLSFERHTGDLDGMIQRQKGRSSSKGIGG